MPAWLSIRDIGKDRKKAIELEARQTGMSVVDLVRKWIDAGIAQSKADLERASWILAAKAGLTDEARDLQRSGPRLARFRRG